MIRAPTLMDFYPPGHVFAPCDDPAWRKIREQRSRGVVLDLYAQLQQHHFKYQERLNYAGALDGVKRNGVCVNVSSWWRGSMVVNVDIPKLSQKDDVFSLYGCKELKYLGQTVYVQPKAIPAGVERILELYTHARRLLRK